jgi:hypothetical protein
MPAPVSAPPPSRQLARAHALETRATGPRAAPLRAQDDAPARQLYGAAALLAASVLSDSALEHYRGRFENPGMFAPLASAAVLLVCATRAALGPGQGAKLGRAPERAPQWIPQDGPQHERRRGRAADRHAGGGTAADPQAPRNAGAAARPGGGAPRSGTTASGTTASGTTASGQPAAAPAVRGGVATLAALPYATACAVGAAGLGFHAYNVLRRPGGLSWANLFYAAPLGAPAALSLAGLIGLAAGQVARGAPTLSGRPAGQALCALAAVGLAGTSVEAALLHFRGAYHNPAMWAPVGLPPVAAALLARSALQPASAPTRLTRLWLGACTWLGLIGVGFHARGIARQMGGWRNWSQNLLSGPPLPAPPSFSALALAGRAALALRARADIKEAA